MSPENFRKISLPEVEILLYLCNFSKEVSQITDWQTYKNFIIILYKCTNIPGIPPKNFRKIYNTELEIYLYVSNLSKKVSQLTDWQTYMKFTMILKQCTNIQGISPKTFKKIFHLELEISLYLSNFNKEVSQKMDWKTCKKFWFIWN